MADNVELNAGSGGDTIAADEISGAKHQRVKIQYGTDGSATDVSDTNPLPVDDAGGSLTVDNAALSVTGGGTPASALRVTIASDSSGVLSVDDNGSTLSVDDGGGALTVDSTVTANLSATDNAVLDSIDTNTSATATAVQVLDNAISGNEMQVDVVAALPAGTNNIGDVDVASIAAGSNLVGDVGIGVRTSGGTTLYKNIDADESEDQVKGSAGQVYWIHAMNLASAKRYLKFYNATAASVTVGTTVPDLTFPLPTQGDTNGAGFVLSIPNGIAFGTAITIAATTGVADNDSGAPGANEVVVNLGYA